MSATTPVHRSWRAIGTGVVVAVTDPPAIDEAAALLDAELTALDAACSRFRPDSELMRLPADGGWHEVSPLLAAAVAEALRASHLTAGSVDPTVAPAMRALGYDRDFTLIREGSPRTEPVAAPGSDAVELDEAACRIRLRPGTSLDLGASAKAWAADRAAARIHGATGTGTLVGLGGDIAVAGDPPGDGWRVTVLDSPDGPGLGERGEEIRLRDGGLATSCVTVRRWISGGTPAHHIVDPATGLPAAGPWRRVSVAAATCADANAASTAAIVRGETAQDWLASLGLPSLLVRHDGSEVRVAGWPQAEVAVA